MILLLACLQDAVASAEQAARSYRAGDLAAAYAHAAEAARLDADLPDAQRWLAISATATGRLDEGRTALAAARALGVKFDDLDLAAAFALGGDLDEGLRRAFAHETRHGRSARSLETRAWIKERQGPTDDAIALYREAIAAGSERSSALRLAVARLLARRDRFDEALAELETIRGGDPPAAIAHEARRLRLAVEGTRLQRADERAAPLLDSFRRVADKLGHPSIRELMGAEAEPLGSLLARMEAAVRGGAELDRAAVEAVDGGADALPRLRENRWVGWFVATEYDLAAAWGRRGAAGAERRQRQRILGALMARLYSPR